MKENNRELTSEETFKKLYDQEEEDIDRAVENLKKHTKKDPKELEDKLDKLMNDSKKIEEKLETLLDSPLVREYEKMTRIKKSIENDIRQLSDELKEAIQDECKHPMWYNAGPVNPNDPYGDVTYQYICLECCEERYERPRNKEVVYSELTFGETREEYKKFKEKYELLQEKYGSFIKPDLKKADVFQKHLESIEQKGKQK